MKIHRHKWISILLTMLITLSILPSGISYAAPVSIVSSTPDVTADRGGTPVNVPLGGKGIPFDISSLNMSYSNGMNQVVPSMLNNVKVTANGSIDETYKFSITYSGGILMLSLKNPPPSTDYQHPYQLIKHALYNIYIPQGAFKNADGSLINGGMNFNFVTNTDQGNYRDDILVTSAPENGAVRVDCATGKIELEFIDEIALAPNVANNIDINTTGIAGAPSYGDPDSILNYNISVQGNKLTLQNKSGKLKDFAHYTITMNSNAVTLKDSTASISNGAVAIRFTTDNLLESTYPVNNQENVEVEPTVEFRFKYPIDLINAGNITFTSNADSFSVRIPQDVSTSGNILRISINDLQNGMHPLRKNTLYKVTLGGGTVQFHDYPGIVNTPIDLCFITRGEGDVEGPKVIRYSSNPQMTDDITALESTQLDSSGSIYIQFDKPIREDKQAQFLSLLQATNLYKIPTAAQKGYDPLGKICDTQMAFYPSVVGSVYHVIPSTITPSVLAGQGMNSFEDISNLEKVAIDRVEIVQPDKIKITPGIPLYNLNKYKVTIDNTVIEDLNGYNVEKPVVFTFWTRTSTASQTPVWEKVEETKAQSVIENKQAPYKSYSLSGVPPYGDFKSSASADIVFVIDNSDSMFPLQTTLRNNISAFLGALKNQGVTDVRMGLVSYADSSVKTQFSGSDWTTDQNDIMNAIGSLSNIGGTENLMAALDTAASYSFKANAQTANSKHIVFITDEDADDEAYLSRELATLKNKGILVHGIYKTHESDVSELNSVVHDTGGVALDVDDSTWGDQLSTKLGEYIAYAANSRHLVIDINGEIIVKAQDEVVQVSPKLIKRITFDALKNITLKDINNSNSSQSLLGFSRYELQYYFENGVKKTKLHLYPDRFLENGKSYRLSIPAGVFQSRSGSDPGALEVNFTVEGDKTQTRGVYSIENNMLKAAELKGTGEGTFTLVGYNFTEDIESVTLGPGSSSKKTITIPKEDIFFEGVTRIRVKIRGDNAAILGDEANVGDYPVSIRFAGDPAGVNYSSPVSLTILGKGAPVPSAFFPADGSTVDENALTPVVIDGVKRYFLKVTFKDYDDTLMFNYPDGLNNLMVNCKVVARGSGASLIDTQFLDNMLKMDAAKCQSYKDLYIFTKDAGKMEKYLYIPVKSLRPQTKYDVTIEANVVLFKNGSSNSKFGWSFSTMSNPIVTSVSIGSVVEDYDEDEPIILNGDFFSDSVTVYFNDEEADRVKVKTSADGKKYLEVYLPGGRNKLEPGVYNISVENDQNHQRILYGSFSVVKAGDNIPNEEYRVKDSNSKGDVLSDLKVSEDTLELKSKYSDERSIKLDLDELMGRDVLVRKIKVDSGKNDVIGTLETKSVWGDITVYKLRRDLSADGNEILLKLGRVEPVASQVLKGKLGNKALKSELIQITGENFSCEKVVLAIPYTNSSGNSLKVMRYDEETRSWQSLGSTVNIIDRLVKVESYKPGIFVVVE